MNQKERSGSRPTRRWVTAMVATNGVLALAVIGFFLWQEPSRLGRVEESLSSNELITAYQDDPSGADQRFRMRIIEVTGPLAGFGHDARGNTYLLIAGSGAKLRIQAFLAKEQDELSKAETGQRVIVRGRCIGIQSDIVLADALLKGTTER